MSLKYLLYGYIFEHTSEKSERFVIGSILMKMCNIFLFNKEVP